MYLFYYLDSIIIKLWGAINGISQYARKIMYAVTLGMRGGLMNKEYQKLATEIVAGVGGKENIIEAYHCQTRLRFKLKDESKADKVRLEALQGVAKVLYNAGIYQVVIGTYVADVFVEVEKLVETSEKSASEAEKTTLGQKIFDFIVGTFEASGMIVGK
jgi:glucose-like phosphotransferase system IIB component